MTLWNSKEIYSAQNSSSYAEYFNETYGGFVQVL